MNSKPATRGRARKITYWTVTVWLALGMVATGLGQLLQAHAGQGGLDMVRHLGYPAYLVTLLGVWKVAGALAVLLPRFPVVKEWAYAGFFFIMSGALFSHLAVEDPLTADLPSLLLLLLTVTSWYLRPASRKLPNFVH